ncbi:hypothetical protein [Bacillus cereus group sp. BfR-BA-02730]|uniref:hypothetical protein n=1 Tax=Bacillus cereus group sp. BfR-BA-02730 TaxID=3094893 RepID=UPI0029C3520E|nr:hypothetical protein [Bacillus cereus group sp. BfR-BA-02730]MDX5808230.1 hypothetical protein [Bacillus cereus group sp. BfR-BA-02730]
MKGIVLNQFYDSLSSKSGLSRASVVVLHPNEAKTRMVTLDGGLNPETAEWMRVLLESKTGLSNTQLSTYTEEELDSLWNKTMK